MLAAFVIGLIAGIASPMHASVNGRIREDLKSTYLTAINNFVVAGLIIAAILMLTEHCISIPLGTIAEQPAWIWFGGPCGVVIVTLNVVCLPKLGSAANVMLICFGQIMSGLLVDQFGLFQSPEIHMTWLRTIGAVLVIIGIVMVNGMKRDASAGSGMLLYVILAILDGVACTGQVAINGTLKNYAGSAFKATLISMICGLITAIIVSAMVYLIGGANALYDSGGPEGRKGIKPWMAVGPLIAIIIVGGNAVAAPVLGTGVTTMLNLVGMMGTGLLIDAVGFLGIEKKPVTMPKIIGMLLMLAGTALISLI